MHLLMDRAGLRLGGTTRRWWRELHAGLDAGTVRIVVAPLTAKEADGAAAGALLDQVTSAVALLVGNGGHIAGHGREVSEPDTAWAKPGVARPVTASMTFEAPKDRRAQMLLADIAVGLFAGLVATQVTNLAQGPLQRMTPDSVARQERRVRPGASSSLVAARKVAGRLHCSPSRQKLGWLGKAIHFGIGVAWGPVYGLLRRHGGLGPFGAALASGAAMSLILDEGMVPALGLSAPNRDYPVFTHARGFLAHLVYGAAAALAAEGFGRLVGRTPGPA